METDCVSSDTLETGRAGVLNTGSSTLCGTSLLSAVDLDTERLGVFLVFFNTGELKSSVSDLAMVGWTDFLFVAEPLLDCKMETSVVLDVLDISLGDGDLGQTDLRVVAAFLGKAVSSLFCAFPRDFFGPAAGTLSDLEHNSWRLLPFWYIEDRLVRVLTPGGERTFPWPFLGFS